MKPRIERDTTKQRHAMAAVMRQLRARLGPKVRQPDITKVSGVKAQEISKIENGHKPRMCLYYDIQPLAEAYGVSSSLVVQMWEKEMEVRACS